MREVVFDVETTGLSFSEDRVVEIGCVELIDLVATGKTYHTYINPQMRMSPGAQKIHGLTTEFLKTKRTFKQVVDRFLAFIGDSQLVAHNSDFDMGMINAELRRHDRPILTNPVVNTLPLAREVKKGGLHNIDALCRHYKIDTSKRDKHGALLDSELLAKVYMELRGGRQFGLGLEIVKTKKQAEVVKVPVHPFRSRLTEADRAAHRTFIESLGSSTIWAQYLAEPEPYVRRKRTA